jgi:hypothetical protein
VLIRKVRNADKACVVACVFVSSAGVAQAYDYPIGRDVHIGLVAFFEHIASHLCFLIKYYTINQINSQ